MSSVNGDQFRGSSDEEIQLWNECARLVTNAIVYFNSEDTQPAVDQLRIPRRYQENRYRQTGIPCGHGTTLTSRGLTTSN
ncbi:Tn3 family transposase [Klebsiella quasipneumoniae]|uniref:Tn3 family transposase n=1 Tax=Klebsiella quasipneumoniae TaxID=1463165 RepID=UPI00388D93B3